jgi:hypothetical protein
MQVIGQDHIPPYHPGVGFFPCLEDGIHSVFAIKDSFPILRANGDVNDRG